MHLWEVYFLVLLLSRFKKKKQYLTVFWLSFSPQLVFVSILLVCKNYAFLCHLCSLALRCTIKNLKENGNTGQNLTFGYPGIYPYFVKPGTIQLFRLWLRPKLNTQFIFYSLHSKKRRQNIFWKFGSSKFCKISTT